MAKNVKVRAEKRAEEKRNDNSVSATAKYVRISPSKVNRVLASIRGKKYEDAVAILNALPNTSSISILKVLNSAAANAEHNKGLNKDDLFVATALANPGPVLKRMIPKAKGQGARILKRTTHITVILEAVK